MNRRKNSVAHSVDFWTRWTLAGILLCILLGAIFWRVAPLRSSDPDMFYHLEMARRTAVEGGITHLPEMDNLMPKEEWANGYWLFTFLSSVAYRVAGEQGVFVFGFLCALATLLLLLWIAHRDLTIGVSLSLVVGLLLVPNAANRLFLLRPHTLSMFLFLVMAWALLARNYWVAFVCGVLHSWSYAAPILPLAICAVALVFYRREPRDWALTAGAGIGGVIVGLVSHPYFPKNLTPIWNTFRLSAPGAVPSSVALPTELAGVPFSQMLGGCLFLCLPLFLNLLRIPKGSRTRFFGGNVKPATTEVLFVTICLAGLLALATVSFRALEYAIPLAVLAWVLFLRDWKDATLQGAFVAVGIFFALPAAWELYGDFRPGYPGSRSALEALGALPMPADGKKVLNVEWSHGAYVLYERPGYRFVDVGDPRALPLYNPQLAALREELKLGKTADPYGIVKYSFNADYILLYSGPLQTQLDKSPHFRQISNVAVAETPGLRIYVYEAAPRRLPLQVKEYETANERGLSASSYLPDEQRTTFLNLTTNNECETVSPKITQRPLFKGATLLALGGVGDVRVSWKGKKLFRGVLGQSSILETEVVLPLPGSLASTSDLSIEVCSLERGAPMGVISSLFTKKYLQALCDWKGGLGIPASQKEGWTYSNVAATTCLAPYAGKAFKPSEIE